MESVHDYDVSLEERSYRFKYKGKYYILREASALAASQYRDKWMSCMRLGPDGKPSQIVGMAAVETLLVSLCCFELEMKDGQIVEDGKEKAVPQGIVNQWPARMQKELFEKAKQFSDLSEETPERQTLDEILSREDSPVQLAVFQKYIAELPDMDDKYDYRPFKNWYQVPAEEQAKNEPSDMTVGSA